MPLSIDDIKFIQQQKISLRHVTTKEHLENHLDPHGLRGDAYAFADLRTLHDKGDEASLEEVNSLLETEPDKAVENFTKRLTHVINKSIHFDAYIDHSSTAETHFLVLKDMRGADCASDMDHGAYRDGFGKCGGQSIKPDQVTGVFGFSKDEIDASFSVQQLTAIALEKCVETIKKLRQDHEMGIVPQQGQHILQEAVHTLENSEPTHDKPVMRIGIGSFETKLGEITGLDFLYGDKDVAIAVQGTGYSPRETTLLFQPLLPNVQARITTLNGKTAYHIDKKTTDMQAFEQNYAIRKQEIAHAQKLTDDLSQKTGLPLENKMGIVTLYDDNAREFLNNAHKNEKIADLQKSMNENGYDYTFIVGRNTQESGIAFTRSSSHASLGFKNANG